MKKIYIIVIILALIAVATYLYFQKVNKIEPDYELKFKESDQLLVVKDGGGFCDYGGCYSVLIIDNKGNYQFQEGPGVRYAKGQLSPEDINKLITMIDQTDFTFIKSRPFTGECPTAYDLPENKYNFVTKGEIIDDCVYAVDYQYPLFKTIKEIRYSISSQAIRKK